MTRGELVTELATTLGARHEARFVVEDVLGSWQQRPGLAAQVADADIATARALAVRRAAGEPLQYVLGHWAFRALDLLVDPRVLIPRPETELVVDVALGEVGRLGAPAPVLVDAGTGSGAIALALATELAPAYPRGQVWAIDASTEALAVAEANLRRVCDRHAAAILEVTLAQGSWLDALPPSRRGGVDLIVSNPPYVAEAEWSGLPADVRCEPRRALVAGAARDGTPGLGDVEAVLAQGWDWLARPGTVVLELAPHQADVARKLARSIGYGDVRIEPDLARRPRVLVARVQ